MNSTQQAVGHGTRKRRRNSLPEVSEQMDGKSALSVQNETHVSELMCMEGKQKRRHRSDARTMFVMTITIRLAGIDHIVRPPGGAFGVFACGMRASALGGRPRGV